MLLAVCPNPSVDTFVWVESLAPGKVHRASREKRYPGGKGIHVALAAAELGEEVTLLGFWGGETGRWIKNECNKRNIHCIGPELKDWSRSCITFKSNGVYDDTELLGCGPEISPAVYLEFKNIFNGHVNNSGVITLSGSWPEGAPSFGYAELIKEAKKFDKPVFLDATGESFQLGLKEKPYAIHLNDAESKELSNLSDMHDIIDHFRQYAELVAITAGKEGLFLGINDELIHGNVDIDRIYSTVGSGDCLTAGLAIGFMKKMDTEKMLKLGVACGGANCLREDLGMLYKHDVEKLLKRIKINKNC
jgi:tagatose 6-phosphate kinase